MTLKTQSLKKKKNSLPNLGSYPNYGLIKKGTYFETNSSLNNISLIRLLIRLNLLKFIEQVSSGRPG